MEEAQIIKKLSPWYHNFSVLGIETTLGEMREKCSTNQRDKEPDITKMYKYLKENEINISNVLDLFASDGFYAFLLNSLIPNQIKYSLSIDNDNNFPYQDQFDYVKNRLGTNNLFFNRCEILQYLNDTQDVFDVCLCFGGLYHMDNPFMLLKKLLSKSRIILIQTVISLEDHKRFFISPAPGWTWGCRFNENEFRYWCEELGVDIIWSNVTELRANVGVHNRGSMCAILKKK